MHNHSDHGHQHGIANHDITNVNERSLYLATILTIIFMIIELMGGIWSNSLILIADAGHMLIDASALVMTVFAIRVAKKPADEKRSYGYKRGQVIVAFINSMTLLATTIWIIIQSIQRLLNPVPILGEVVTVMAIIGVLVNGYTAYILNKSSKNDINIRSAFVHVIGDLLGYVAAIITGMVVIYTNWMQIDPILSLIFSLLMIKSAWAIVKESIHILMEGVPKHLDTAEIASHLKSHVVKIVNVHHMHVWALTPDSFLLTAHIRINDINHSFKVIKAVKVLLKEHFKIAHATIEIETESCADSENHDILPSVD